MTSITCSPVAQGSLAERVGLRGGEIQAKVGKAELLLGGDVILAVDGVRVEDKESMQRIYESVRQRPEGSRLKLDVLRGGKRLHLSTAR